MKKLIHTLLCAGALALAFAHSSAAPDTRKSHQVVFELTSNEKEAWNGVLNNIENLRAAFGEQDTRIELVVHGKGLGFLKNENTEFRSRMQKLADTRVVFAACENTMKRQKVLKGDLLPFVVTVDSGVAEVVRKQEAGWSYVRTGG